jgi:hypothetical protein
MTILELCRSKKYNYNVAIVYEDTHTIQGIYLADRDHL